MKPKHLAPCLGALALLLASSALAEGWTSSLKANSQTTYEFRSTDSTGFSDATPAGQCGSTTIGWHRGNSPSAATAELYACPAADSAIGECTLIDSYGANASGSVVLPGQGWLKVNRSALPTAGTVARLFMFCSQSSGGGGSGTAGVIGVIGSNATDSTLEHFASLTHAEYLPTLPRFHFSSDSTDATCATALTPGGLGGYATGNDVTGDGTRQRPYRSLGRAMALTQKGHAIAVLDACDTWNDETGDASDLECKSPGCSTPYLVADAGGVRNMSWTSSAPAKCTDPDGLCFAIIGSDPSGRYRPTIDFTNLTAGGNPAQNWFNISMIYSQGWAHFENLRLGTSTAFYPANCATGGDSDLFRIDSTGRVSVVNIEAFMCADTTRNNEFWTSHYNSVAVGDPVNFFVSLNNQIHYPEVAALDQSAPAYLSAGSSALAVIGGYLNATFVSAVDGGGRERCLGLGPGTGAGVNYAFVHMFDCVFVDDGVVAATPLLGGFSCTADTEAGAICRVFVSRSRVLNMGDLSGFWFGESGGVGTQAYYVGYRNSSIGNDAYFRANSTIAATRLIDVEDRCSFHYKGTAAGTDSALVWHTGGDCGGLDIDLYDTGGIEGDTQFAQIEATNYATSALAVAGSVTRACNNGAGWVDAWNPEILVSNPLANELSSGVAGSAAASVACTQGSVTERFLSGLYIPTYLTGSVAINGARQNVEGAVAPLGW